MQNLLMLCAVLPLIPLIWGFFVEPQRLKVKTYHVACSELKGLKAVFASDFHIGVNEQKRLDKIVELINAQEADIVFLGGDYVCGHLPERSMKISEIGKSLSRIKAPLGIYAVMGNHDSYYGLQTVRTVLKHNGIWIFANSGLELGFNNKKFYVGGVEDLKTGTPNLSRTLQNAQEPIILLSHSPDIFAEVPDNVVLTLAGHTHGGQIYIPFWGAPIANSRFGQKYLRGHIREGKKNMIVSVGLGTSVLPIRFFATPEIVVIKFE